MTLAKELQKVLNRTPHIQGIPHAFYSKEADLNMNGQNVSVVKDECGGTVDINFIGGCSIGYNGRVIPSIDEGELSAPPETYEYIGYMDVKGILVYSDYTPEIPMQKVEIPSI